MNIRVNPIFCCGCGGCSHFLPAVFEKGEEDIAFVIVNPVPHDLERECKRVKEECPSRAITTEQEGGTE